MHGIQIPDRPHSILWVEALRHPLAQAFLINLVSACERQLLKKKDTPRMLVRGTIGESELLEIFLGRARTRTQHDERVWHLAFHFMIERHYQRLMHGGMTPDHGLALYRKDVLTATHEHVIVASDEIIEPFFIAAADVAGVEPTVTQALSRFSRQVLIAEEDAGVL